MQNRFWMVLLVMFSVGFSYSVIILLFLKCLGAVVFDLEIQDKEQVLLEAWMFVNILGTVSLS